MLVRALEIHDLVKPAVVLAPDAGKSRKMARIFHRESMGRTGVEPHVEHVVDLLVTGRIVLLAEEARGRARREPGVGAFRLEGIGDALVDVLVDEDVVGAPLDEDRDRHAPGALARHDPIGTIADHAGDAVLARRRHPARLQNFTQRDFA